MVINDFIIMSFTFYVYLVIFVNCCNFEITIEIRFKTFAFLHTKKKERFIVYFIFFYSNSQKIISTIKNLFYFIL